MPATVNQGFRFRFALEYPAAVAPAMFEKLAVAGRARDVRERQTEKQEPDPVRRPVEKGLSGEEFLASVFDWRFVSSLNKPLQIQGKSSNDVYAQRPAKFLLDDCFLPVGFAPIGFDTNPDPMWNLRGQEALFVFMRSNARQNESPPFLESGVKDRLGRAFNVFPRTNAPLIVVFIWIPQDHLNRVLNFIYFNDTTTLSGPEGAETMRSAGEDSLSLDVQSDDDKVVEQIRLWIRGAIYRNASDIHVEPMEGKGRIRIRVDGDLVCLARDVPLPVINTFITWIKTQSGMDTTDNRRPLDGSIRLSYTNAGTQRRFDVRISSIPVAYGQKMVLRLLDPHHFEEDAKLGLKGIIQDRKLCNTFSSALMEHEGIILVTGPTGSGKTTTLNTALRELLNPVSEGGYGDTKNIVTIEDPVEYAIPGTNQTPVNERAGVTFAATLRSLLRQDPDIVLVGEIRDSETAQIAVQAALTGHLILATLHTNDALGSISRLEDLGISPFLIGNTLRLVQAQRLIQRFCSECGKRPDKRLSQEDLERKVAASRLAPYLDRFLAPGVEVYDPEIASGQNLCVHCNNTGYKGRVAVMEMAYFSDELVTAIEKRLPSREIEAVARAHSGYRPMIEDAIGLVARGVTSMREIISKISLKDVLSDAE